MVATLRVPVTHLASATLLLLALSACGGGGGGGGVSTPDPVAVNDTNQDELTSAAMVGIDVGVVGGSLGLTADGASSPLAVGPALRRALLAGTKKASAGRKSIAASIELPAEDCALSGAVTVSIDDRDNDGQLSVGDVLGVSFDNCSDVAGEVIDGSMSAAYTQLELTTTTRIGASISVDDLTVIDGDERASLDGGFQFTVTDNATVSTMRMVVPDSLRMQASTSTYSDTVTLFDGYTVESQYEIVSGRTTSAATGWLASAAAGGAVQVETLEDIVAFDSEDYPRSGRIELVGATGALQATVLSTSEVQIDLDADDDGSFEESKTVPWTELL